MATMSVIVRTVKRLCGKVYHKKASRKIKMLPEYCLVIADVFWHKRHAIAGKRGWSSQRKELNQLRRPKSNIDLT